jgi:hypothetical protein
MKKFSQDTKLFKSKLAEEKNSQNLKIKTTNVNILLNRVKLDERKDVKKKLIFLGLLLSLISLVGFFAIL